MANTTDRLYRMPIGDFLRRRPEAQTCQACGSPLPHGAVFCPSCGVRTDDPHAEPLHDALGLELAQPLGQHAVADTWDSREQLVEASGGWNEGFDHRAGPTLTYQLDRALKGRAVVKAPSDHGE